MPISPIPPSAKPITPLTPGDVYADVRGDVSEIEEGEERTLREWAAIPNGAAANTGVIFPCIPVKLCDISDGTSHTYLLGEKYLNAALYLTGSDTRR